MTRAPDPVERRFAAIVEALSGTPGVILGAQGKKGFGSSALQVNGHIFAMLSSSGRFVVKLPKQRVEALEAAGVGGKFDPGRGRLMKEWLAVDPASNADWLALAREALAFVG